jgi:Uri superfamily endonuclease
MNSGAYQLYIRVNRKVRLKIGALGSFIFPTGIYVYTGSAMKNLTQRVERHKSKTNKKIRWHIDYLLASPAVEIIDVKIYYSKLSRECYYNQKILKMKNAFIPAPGFGSSDCKDCPAHLVGISI